jgi:hypothetical protein
VSRLFFNFKQDSRLFRDHEGVILQDASDVREYALRRVKSLLENGNLHGNLHTLSIQIVDECGVTVLDIPLFD